MGRRKRGHATDEREDGARGGRQSGRLMQQSHADILTYRRGGRPTVRREEDAPADCCSFHCGRSNRCPTGRPGELRLTAGE